MFALLNEPYAIILVSVLLQPHGIVVANFVPGNFGLFRRNSWQPLAEPELSPESRQQGGLTFVQRGLILKFEKNSTTL